jgi:hypothetical protein
MRQDSRVSAARCLAFVRKRAFLPIVHELLAARNHLEPPNNKHDLSNDRRANGKLTLWQNEAGPQLAACCRSDTLNMHSALQ